MLIFKPSDLSLFPQLPRINNILPQHIRTGSHRRQWIQIGMRHPNSQNCILLSKCLPTTDTVIINRADCLPQKELQTTGNQCSDSNHDFRKTIRWVIEQGIQRLRCYDS